jgi:hypothetical protein
MRLCLLERSQSGKGEEQLKQVGKALSTGLVAQSDFVTLRVERIFWMARQECRA